MNSSPAAHCNILVGFEVLTAVLITVAIFSFMSPCNLYMDQGFRET
jgi:hypothetical protein